MKSRRFMWALVGLACIVAALAIYLRRERNRNKEPENNDTASASNAVVSSPESVDDSALARVSLGGRVTDAAKRPIEGASVCAFASSKRLVSADTREPRCVQTDAQGRYRLDNLFAATYRVSASAPHHRPATWSDRDGNRHELALKAGESRDDIDLVLEDGGELVRGRVKDISGGPIASAVVTITSQAGGDAVTQSNAAGEWQTWTAPGTIHATGIADGYAPGSKDGVAPGQFIEIILTPESVLEGRVVESGTDTPVAGVRVTAGPSSGFGPAVFANGLSGGDSALTDAEGHFRIARLQPGRYKPEASGAHRWGTARESVLLGLGETSSEVRIEVYPAMVVSGRIALSDGQGCKEGSVNLTDKKTSEMKFGQVEGDGQVQVEGVFPSAYDVDVHCENALPEDKYDPITVADKDVTGRVWKVGTGASVRGVVVEPGGQPVPSAGLYAMPKGGEPRARTSSNYIRTEKDGSFQMRGLKTGTYGVYVDVDGHSLLKEPFELKVDRDIDGVRIVVQGTGTIEGTVVDNTGAPVSGLGVQARGQRYDWNHTSTRDDGTFVLKPVSAGDYRVWAEQGFTRVRAPGTKDEDVQGVSTTVKAGQTAHVKVVVESRNGQIHGRVIGEAGEPMSDVFVDAERESEDPSSAAGRARRTMQWGWRQGSPVLAELDGTFTITKLSPGTYTVRAFRKGGGDTVAEKVRVGSEVTLTIRAGASISGTVVTSGGKSPDRFSVSVQDDKTGFSRQESFFHTDGAFALRDLPAGNYQVAGEASGGRALTQITLSQSEKKQGVRLQIEDGATVRGQVISLETGQPVPGMQVFARPAKGASSGAMIPNDVDQKSVSDAQGRYEIERCPPGRILLGAFAKDRVSEYGFVYVPTTVEAGRTNEAPPLRVPHRRTKGMEVGGDLGFTTQEMTSMADLEQQRIMVAVVRPNGPAARAGLVAGDEIVSVDGYSVAPPNAGLFWTLSRVPEGTAITLGLSRGASVSIQAEKPL